METHTVKSIRKFDLRRIRAVENREFVTLSRNLVKSCRI